MRWPSAALMYALFALGVALVMAMAVERQWRADMTAAVIDFAGFWLADGV